MIKNSWRMSKILFLTWSANFATRRKKEKIIGVDVIKRTCIFEWKVTT